MKGEKKLYRGVVVRSNCDCNLCRVAFGRLPKDPEEARAARRRWDTRRKPKASA